MTHSSQRLVRPPVDLESDERPIATALEQAAEQAACPQPDLVRLLDAEVLPVDVAAVVRQHVAQCRACQSLAVEGMIGPDEEEERAARRRVWARIDAAVRTEPTSEVPFWRRPAWAWPAVPALGAALAALVFLVARVPVDVPPAAPVPVAFSARALLPPSILRADRPIFPAPEVVRLRGDAQPQPSTRDRIEQALARSGGDFAAALPALQVIATNAPESPEALICVGVAFIEAGRPADAAAPLGRARAMSSGPVADEAEWFSAIALARAARGREAADVLRPLCQRTGARQAIACAGIMELESVPGR